MPPGVTGASDGTLKDPFEDIIKALGGEGNLLQNLVGRRGQSSSNVNTLESSLTGTSSPLALAQIGQTFPGMLGEYQSGDFSKEAAVRDAMGGVKNLFREFSQGILPQLGATEAATGAYGGTTKQQLGDEAFARTVAQGEGLISKQITDYAGIRNQQAQNINQLIRSSIDANKVQDMSRMQNAATVGDVTTKGMLQNDLFQGGLGALGIYSLLGGKSGVGNLLGQGSDALYKLWNSWFAPGGTSLSGADLSVDQVTDENVPTGDLGGWSLSDLTGEEFIYGPE